MANNLHRISASLINTSPEGQAYGSDSTAPVMDLSASGTFDQRPEFARYASNQPRVRRNITVMMINAPLMWNHVVGGASYIRATKAFFESQPQVFEGFISKYDATVDEVPFGGGGQRMQEFTDVKGTPSELSLTIPEKRGSPNFKMVKAWFDIGIMHHETKAPLIPHILSHNDTDIITMTPEWYTASLVAWESDRSGLKVEHAWIASNVAPTTTGSIEGKSDKNSPGEFVTNQYSLTSLVEDGPGVNAWAQTLLDDLNASNVNPALRAPHLSAIDPVVDAITDTGSTFSGNH